MKKNKQIIDQMLFEIEIEIDFESQRYQIQTISVQKKEKHFSKFCTTSLQT